MIHDFIWQVVGHDAPSLLDKAHKCIQKIVELAGVKEVNHVIFSLQNEEEAYPMFGCGQSIQLNMPLDIR